MSVVEIGGRVLRDAKWMSDEEERGEMAEKWETEELKKRV